MARILAISLEQTRRFLLTFGAMSAHEVRARKLIASWQKRPSQIAAVTLRGFYGKTVRELSLPMRAEICIALGEAAELEGYFEIARYLYASAVSAADPTRDERMYARAAHRALLNASRLGDLDVLTDVASVVESLQTREQTPRLACVGSIARGLERFVREDWTAARKSFEAAMGAAWESHDQDGEALAHHLLAQTWNRLGRLALAKEHVEAARVAAAKAGSWLLERRLALEAIMYRLLARLSAETLAEARKIVEEVRKLGFPRLESLAWSRIARGVMPDRRAAELFLNRSQRLLPDNHPDRAHLTALRTALGKGSANGRNPDRRVNQEMSALAKLARG
jgi:hypothetical protein